MYSFADVLSQTDSAGSSLLDSLAAPLAAAMAAAERLRAQSHSTAASAALDDLGEATAEAMALLELARDLHRAERGRLARTLEPRRLREAMDQVEERWRGRALGQGASLLIAYDGEPECVARLDWRGLHEIFDALIAHALAKVSGGVIEASLRAHREAKAVVIECQVRHSGAGDAADYLGRLLAAEATADEVGGLPVLLGLALADHTIRALGGKLEARANRGAGAVLGFRATCEAAETASVDGEAQTSHGGRNAHVLVVDDNATNRMVVEALCEMFDCSTESVADGLEAVEAARVGRFDVILMDIKMPRMDGLAATRAIRGLAGAAGQAPIIALTANADPDEVRRYLAAGMHGVVEKPIKPDRLLEALDAALAKSTGRSNAAAA